MQQYGIDGAFVQRFVTDLKSAKNEVPLMNMVSSAGQYGQKIVVMYDISSAWKNSACYVNGGAPNATMGSANPNFSITKCVSEDWMALQGKGLTSSGGYLKVYGSKPLVGIWGFGFNPGISSSNGSQYITNPADALALVNWFKSQGIAVMGGIPTYWKTQSNDSLAGAGWTSVYRAFDILSPWMVGRVANTSDVDNFVSNTMKGDITAVQGTGQGYLPVVYPGFSFFNTARVRGSYAPLNQIPRNSGSLYWKQFKAYKDLGLTSMYVAMFDEVDEGTAIFKTAANSLTSPRGASLVHMDADGNPLPNDWYLRVTNDMSSAVKGRDLLLPNNIVATGQDHSILVTWIPSPNIGGNGVKRYRVTLSPNSSFTYIIPGWNDTDVGNSSAVYVPKLLANTVYYVRLRVEDNAGNLSSLTTPVSAKTLPETLLPTNIVATGQDHSVLVTWTHSPVAKANGIKRYLATLSPNSSFSYIIPGWSNTDVGNVSAIQVPKLVANTVYYVRLRVEDNLGNLSLYTAPVSAKTLPDNLLPTNIVATGQDHSVLVTWTHSPVAKANGIKRYQATLSTDSSFTYTIPGWNNTDVGNVTAIHVTKLVADTVYCVRLRVEDNLGNLSSYSTTVSALTPPETMRAAIGLRNFVPTLSILSPDNDARVSGKVRLEVAPSEDTVRVVYSVDGIEMYSTSVAPFHFYRDSTIVSPGVHTITAQAFNESGTASTPVTRQYDIESIISPKAYPNPYRGEPGGMTFAGLDPNSRLTLYTPQGVTVSELVVDGGGNASWNGTNDNGHRLKSGVHIARCKKEGAMKELKILVQE